MGCMKTLALVLALASVGSAQALAPLSIASGGVTRTYRVYTPPKLQENRRLPLVFVLHGAGGTGEKLPATTHFNEIADKNGFIVVYPDGFEKHWNDLRGIPEWTAQAKNIDDVGFFSALIDRLIAENHVDSRRVFVTGISNGGLMSHRLGCELSGKIAAIAPVVRTLTVRLSETCRPSRPVPALMFFGTADKLVPFEGGEQKMGSISTPVLSARQTIDRWAGLDGCGSAPAVENITSRAGQRLSFSSCKQGSEVIGYILEGAGHSWPPGAAEIIWSFFNKHPTK
jgi:polyhydroxybutyrate depolymerase